MPAKQSNGRNKLNLRRITFYALAVAVCLIVGYLESLLSVTLITVVPGVKIGLSNAVALSFVCSGDIKGAWAVNITRICLSALLFGSLVSFLLSLSGGIGSMALACLLSRLKSVSPIGVSIAGGAAHNIFQLLASAVLVGRGVIFYLPVLIAFGAVCGAVCGVLTNLIVKKIKTNGIF